MSSQTSAGDKPNRSGGRPGAVTQQTTAEELLAEFQRVLESAGYPPSAPPSIVSVSAPAAAPRNPADFDAARDDGGDLTTDDGRGGRHDPIGEAKGLRLRRWKLVGSALALGSAAAAGAGLALMPTAPAPKPEIAAVSTQPQSNAQPPVEASVATPSVRVKDGPRADHAEAGDSSVAIDAKELTGKPSSPLDAQRAADSNAAAVGTSADTPIVTTAAARASTASQSSVQSSSVGPDTTPIATISSNSTVSGFPSVTPRLHDGGAAVAEVEVARPAASKADSAAMPTARKTSQKIVEKGVKAKVGAMAAIPYPPLRPAPPARAAVSPAVPAATDPTPAPPAAPAPPPSFAAQSVSQLTNAFGYLTRLPGALIGRATGPGPQAQ